MVKYFHFHTNNHNYDVPLVSCRCSHINNITHHHCKKRCLIGVSKCWIHLLSDNFIRIQPSTIHGAGSGVFTRKRYNHTDRVYNIGDKICQYEGNVISQHNLTHRYQNKTAPYSIILRNRDENNNYQYEDAAEYRGIGSLINHHTIRNNCRFSVTRNNRIQIIATKPINKDTELLINYGQDYIMNQPGVLSSTNNKRLTV